MHCEMALSEYAAMFADKPFGPLRYRRRVEHNPVFFSVYDCNSDAQEY